MLGRRASEPGFRFRELVARERAQFRAGGDDAGRGAAAVEIGEARAMPLGDIDGKQRRRRSRPCGEIEQHARQRERHPGRDMRGGGVGLAAARGDPRRQTQARALAFVRVGGEGVEREILLRRKLLKPRVDHRLDVGEGQREGFDGCAERQSDGIARRLFGALAAERLAPPGEPHRRQIGVARAKARLAQFVIEGGKRDQRVAAGRRGIERAEPFVARVFAHERGAIGVGFLKRAGCAHGAAMSAAATRRPSSCITL